MASNVHLGVPLDHSFKAMAHLLSVGFTYNVSWVLTRHVDEIRLTE